MWSGPCAWKVRAETRCALQLMRGARRASEGQRRSDRTSSHSRLAGARRAGAMHHHYLYCTQHTTVNTPFPSFLHGIVVPTILSVILLTLRLSLSGHQILKILIIQEPHPALPIRKSGSGLLNTKPSRTLPLLQLLQLSSRSTLILARGTNTHARRPTRTSLHTRSRARGCSTFAKRDRVHRANNRRNRPPLAIAQVSV